MTRGFLLFFKMRVVTLYAKHTHTHIYIGFEETSHPRKAHFVGLGEGVKPRLSHALIRGARPDSNSRPAVQISNYLPSRYTPRGQNMYIYIVWPYSITQVHTSKH